MSGGHSKSTWRAALPMRLALATVAAVWLLGCVWSFQEQTEFAAYLGFVFPRLLPLVIDGFAVSMATVAWAASLDARPAVAARLATLVAVAASSASNGVWAWLRVTHDAAHNPITVTVAVAVPVLANLAFEVLLAELRRQVQRRRGLPPPVAVPYPRLIRLMLAPVSTFTEWRCHVLDLTATGQFVGSAAANAVADAAGSVAASVEPARSPEPRRAPAEANGHRLAVPALPRELPAGQPTVPAAPASAATNNEPAVAPASGPVEESAVVAVPRGGPMRMALAPIDRARMTAELHWRRTGDWPSVRELQEQADVSRGTAHTALKALRAATERPGTDRLHLVGNPTDPAAAADVDGRSADSGRSR